MYRDRCSIDEFIQEDPMWEELYRLYLQMKRGWAIKMNATKTFNTVRFLCVCVLMDAHPEDDVEENYLAPLRKISEVNADICCALVLAVLRLMKDAPPRVGYFLGELEAKIEPISYSPLDEQNEYVRTLNFLEEKDKQIGNWAVNLSPAPVGPLYLPHSQDWWENVTGNFEVDCLYALLDFWPSNTDKLTVLKLAHAAGLQDDFFEEIRSDIMLADTKGETADFSEKISVPVGGVFAVWGDYLRARSSCAPLPMPEASLKQATSKAVLEAFLDGVKAATEKAGQSDLLLADALAAKARLEKALADTAMEMERLLKENKALAEAKGKLENENKRLKAEAEKTRAKARKDAAETGAGENSISSLVDKALELGDENSLKELILWMSGMEQERLKPELKRVSKRVKELKAPAPRTQNYYLPGSSHISESDVRGVSIGAPPANRILTQE